MKWLLSEPVTLLFTLSFYLSVLFLYFVIFVLLPQDFIFSCRQGEQNNYFFGRIRKS